MSRSRPDRREVRRLGALQRQAATDSRVRPDQAPLRATSHGSRYDAIETVGAIDLSGTVRRYPDGTPVEWFVLKAWSGMTTAAEWEEHCHTAEPVASGWHESQ